MLLLMKKKYLPLMFLSEYKAVGLHVSMFQNNIKMDINEIPLMTEWTVFNLIYIES